MSTLRLPAWLGEDVEETPPVHQNGHLPEPEDPHRVARMVGTRIGTVVGIVGWTAIGYAILAGRLAARAIGHRVAALRPKEAS